MDVTEVALDGYPHRMRGAGDVDKSARNIVDKNKNEKFDILLFCILDSCRKFLESSRIKKISNFQLVNKTLKKHNKFLIIYLYTNFKWVTPTLENL